jgi:hypothetical protein
LEDKVTGLDSIGGYGYRIGLDWRIRLQDCTGLEDKVTGLLWIGG